MVEPDTDTAGARIYPRRVVYGVASGLACLLLVGCLAAGEIGVWTLDEECLMTFEPLISQAAAEQLVWERVIEMASPARRDEISGAEISEALFSCGLRTAAHRRAWSYYAGGAHTWLVQVRLRGDLIALAAVDATDGEIRAITHGVWD